MKVVDDLLCDRKLLPHNQVNSILTRCRENGTTLNADKFVIAEHTVTFCGFMLSTEGISGDPEKVRAITDISTPVSITGLRSFMGLTNQLAEFSPEISATAQPLQPPMSPQRVFT